MFYVAYTYADGEDGSHFVHWVPVPGLTNVLQSGASWYLVSHLIHDVVCELFHSRRSATHNHKLKQELAKQSVHLTVLEQLKSYSAILFTVSSIVLPWTCLDYNFQCCIIQFKHTFVNFSVDFICFKICIPKAVSSHDAHRYAFFFFFLCWLIQELFGPHRVHQLSCRPTRIINSVPFIVWIGTVFTVSDKEGSPYWRCLMRRKPYRIRILNKWRKRKVDRVISIF